MASTEVLQPRDPQGALVALNRFGFGARGGAASDFSSAASDPRGFVKAELGRPNAALLDAPGLQPSPALAQAVFDYQKDVKQQREAAKVALAALPADKPDVKAASADGMQDGAKTDMMSGGAAPDAMQPTVTPRKEPPKPLNVIQKTFRAEALARLQRATMAECGFVERLVTFWSNHFCTSASKGELARMWSGVVPQQPPTTFTRPACANSVSNVPRSTWAPSPRGGRHRGRDRRAWRCRPARLSPSARGLPRRPGHSPTGWPRDWRLPLA